jgi:hypothetical protein
MSNHEHKQEPPKDPALSTPSEANEGKHINFPEEEEKSLNQDDEPPTGEDEAAKRRREEWKKGIEEGKEEQR